MNIELAHAIAKTEHAHQTYNDGPYYDNHILLVVDVLAQFGYTGTFWVIVALLHDVMEDGFNHLTPAQRYSHIEELFGEKIADTIWSVSGFGHNRKARNADIYAKMTTLESQILKLADRIVNANGSMKSMYRKENDDFLAVVGMADQRMVDRLIEIIG